MKHLLNAMKQHPLHSRRFVAAWIRSPFTVGAVVPSSRFLARAMASQVDTSATGAVIELGAGTGVMTRALLHAGVDADRIMVVERDAGLAHFLERHFPQLKIICADAMKLEEVMVSLKMHGVDAIVSSLPLLSMPRQVRLAIEAQMALAIAGGGKIIQFTYGPKSPISRHTLREHGLSARKVRTVLLNIPPAHVWIYQKIER